MYWRWRHQTEGRSPDDVEKILNLGATRRLPVHAWRRHPAPPVRVGNHYFIPNRRQIILCGGRSICSIYVPQALLEFKLNFLLFFSVSATNQSGNSDRVDADFMNTIMIAPPSEIFTAGT